MCTAPPVLCALAVAHRVLVLAAMWTHWAWSGLLVHFDSLCGFRWKTPQKGCCASHRCAPPEMVTVTCHLSPVHHVPLWPLRSPQHSPPSPDDSAQLRSLRRHRSTMVGIFIATRGSGHPLAIWQLGGWPLPLELVAVLELLGAEGACVGPLALCLFLPDG